MSAVITFGVVQLTFAFCAHIKAIIDQWKSFVAILLKLNLMIVRHNYLLYIENFAVNVGEIKVILFLPGCFL